MIRIFVIVFFFINIAEAKLQPGVPSAVTLGNSGSYSLKGYCISGNGDVTISFGTLILNSPCFGIVGAYQYIGDVSSEVITNPIRQCVDQVPLTSVCSEYTDNLLAPPSVALDFAPLVLIDETNEASYTVSGSCAPSGASLSVDIGVFTGIINGSCSLNNRFIIRDDVSLILDGTSYPVLVTIDDGGSTDVASTTVDKASSGLDPIPSVIGVTTSFVDTDLDTWLEAGDSIDFLVEFSEVVTATGSVRLSVGLNSSDKFANYLSGAGTTTLTFRMNITSGDEQCDGRFVLKEIDLNGGAVVDVSVQNAEFRSLPNSIVVERVDAEAPFFGGLPGLISASGTTLESVLFGGDGFRENESCSTASLEASIGETTGGTEVTPYLPIPLSTYYSYTIQDGVDGFSFFLFGATDYYVNLRAIDEAGNMSGTVSTAPWQVAIIYTIPNLILYVDASEEASILDPISLSPLDVGFSGAVATFLDSSGSANVHNFTTSSAALRATYNFLDESLDFDQAGNCMAASNHAELNLATTTQRSLSTVFQVGADTNTLQVLFEEGGGTRGMNIYLYQDRVYCGFWNLSNDGDGAQPFIGLSTPILAGQTYNVTSVFDYTNYTGPGGPDGSFNCYVNGVSMGATLSTTTRLYAHSGDVRLGCTGTSTIIHTGSTGSGFRYFGGKIMEFMMFNSPPDGADVLDLYNYLQTKWGL